MYIKIPFYFCRTFSLILPICGTNNFNNKADPFSFMYLQFLDQDRIVTASSTGAVTIFRHHQNSQVLYVMFYGCLVLSLTFVLQIEESQSIHHLQMIQYWIVEETC